MTCLVITRGVPGCGKSTSAREWVAQDPAHRAEVNRDMLRLMLHGGYADQEAQVNTARDALIEQLLKHGVSVISSDTNLPQRVVRDLIKIARRASASVDILDLTHVPLETCLSQNKARGDKDPVPEAYIRSVHSRFVAPLKGKPLPWPEEPPTSSLIDLYTPPAYGPTCVIVDIDGTVALKGARNAYDYSRVHEDRPNHAVIEAICGERRAGNAVIFLSGREGTAECRLATSAWLDEHMPFSYWGLYMRPAGDMRKDSIVKRELFDTYIRKSWIVKRVYDDRNQVVDMWREVLGLTCLQVAPGDF